MTIKSIKFSEASMINADSILECADIVHHAKKQDQILVTTSTVYGNKNELINIINFAKKQKPRIVTKQISLLEKKYKEILSSIETNKNNLDITWNQEFLPILEKLRAITYGTSLVGDITEKTEARILSFGGKLSTLLMIKALEKKGVNCNKIESEKIIKTDSNYLNAKVDIKKTISACKKNIIPLLKNDITPIVTGSIGKDTHGDITLLGTGGNDYTSSILAIALNANSIEIWGDTNGITSISSDLVEKPISWEILDMPTISEMAYSGAKIVHPKSITLAVKKNIPIYILNTFNRKFEGTKIVKNLDLSGIKGIIARPNNIILHLDNPTMLDETGFISKISNTVKKHNVPMDVLATSETSFSFSIDINDYSKKLNKDLSKFADIKVIKNLTKISLIGVEIAFDALLLSSIFQICHENNILIKTVSIGASNRNITIIVDNKNCNKLLKLLHKKLIKK